MFVRCAISFAALLLVVIRGMCPSVFAAVDSIALALIAVSVVPWVIGRVSKLSIPGFFEAELKDIKQVAVDALQEARKAGTKSEQLFIGSLPPAGDANGSSEKLKQLAQTYLRTRAEMGSGQARTGRMTTIFRDMVGEAHALGQTWDESLEWLSGDDSGRNLAAIAHAYAFPTEDKLGILLQCVEKSRQPFVQYWGLFAINNIVDASGLRGTSPKIIEILKKLEGSIPSDTDRSDLISNINWKIDSLLRTGRT